MSDNEGSLGDLCQAPRVRSFCNHYRFSDVRKKVKVLDTFVCVRFFYTDVGISL